MKTVLVIGGYGQFGGRLCRRLSTVEDLSVLVGGRTLSKAEALCADIGGNLKPVLFDTCTDLEKNLKALAPDIVVDAAGPFQPAFKRGGREYALARACINLGIHYIDLSDSGAFTKGITTLDADAKQAGIAVLSGASSVPALSSAVVDAAQENFAHITAIEGGISPGGKIDIGLSVTQAVLSYLGKPLKVWRGGAWGQELGYSRVHSATIDVKGVGTLRRKFGLCDAPDLLLFPEHYKGVETVRFYGSQELWVIHIFLRILAWLAKKSIVRNLQTAAPMFRWVGTQLGRFASETGGMYMCIDGLDAQGNPIRQTWNLIATDGDGPFIPTLAAEILILRWLNTSPTSGARPAVSEITLEEFQKAFGNLAITTAFDAVEPAPYLFARVLNDGFKALPQQIQNGHKVSNTKIMQGQVDVVRGENPLCQFIAAIVGFAKTGTAQSITVTMDVRESKEIWTRTISGQDFQSVLSYPKKAKLGEIHEQFGPAKFLMKLRADGDVLHYDILSGTIFGIPMPKLFLPKSITHERVENGKFIFDVEIRLPALGRLVAYKGWLE